MTQKQLDFLTAIYKNDLTLKEIYKKANICYEDFLEITRTKETLTTLFSGLPMPELKLSKIICLMLKRINFIRQLLY